MLRSGVRFPSAPPAPPPHLSGVNQAASETGRSAHELLSASGELSKQAETLRAEVDKFVAQVRAA